MSLLVQASIELVELFLPSIYLSSLCISDVSFLIIQVIFIFQATMIVDEDFLTKLKNLKQFNLKKKVISKEVRQVNNSS
jgi:hypothetical protein